jgi:hypothetical protein
MKQMFLVRSCLCSEPFVRGISRIHEPGDLLVRFCRVLPSGKLKLGRVRATTRPIVNAAGPSWPDADLMVRSRVSEKPLLQHEANMAEVRPATESDLPKVAWLLPEIAYRWAAGELRRKDRRSSCRIRAVANSPRHSQTPWCSTITGRTE